MAVLDGAQADLSAYQHRSEKDYAIEWFSGTIGAGGQNHQKTQNCARLTHLPTGLVKTAQTRSRQNSRKAAMAAMNAELDRLAEQFASRLENQVRRAQVGVGQRSDKRRTYRFQDGLAHDHLSGKSASIAKVMGGQFDLLWSNVDVRGDR